MQHNLGLGKGHDDGDGVCFHGSETGQEQEVGGIRLALPKRKTKKAKRAQERHPERPLVCLDPVLVCRRCHRDEAHGGRRKELDSSAGSQHMRHFMHMDAWDASQDGVHLSHKRHPDIQRGLCHHTAKLEVIR